MIDLLAWSLIVGFAGTIPALIPERPSGEPRWHMFVKLGGIYSLLSLGIFWILGTTFSGPFWGVGWWLANLWVGSTVAYVIVRRFHWKSAIVGTLLALVAISPTVLGSSWFTAEERAKMIGSVEKSDNAPMALPQSLNLFSVQSIRDAAAAALKADSRKLDRQFSVGEPTFQKFGSSEIVACVPLKPRSFSQTLSGAIAPGWILVQARGSELVAEVKTTNAAGKELSIEFSPDAYWSANLSNLLRDRYPKLSSGSTAFEVDEFGNPWWVVALTIPDSRTWGVTQKIDSVVLVNPSDGETQKFELSQIPEWVDNAVPRDLILEYVDWWAANRRWFNGKGEASGAAVTEGSASFARLTLDQSGKPIWYVGLCSPDSKKLVAVVAVSTKSLGVTEYALTGRSERAAMKAAADTKAGTVDWPELYCAADLAAWIVPARNADGKPSVVLVPLATDAQVVLGDGVDDAVLRYRNSVVPPVTQQVATAVAATVSAPAQPFSPLVARRDMSGARLVRHITIRRIGRFEPGDGHPTIFYLDSCEFQNPLKIFEASGGADGLDKDQLAQLVLMKPGDHIEIEFPDNPAKVVPLLRLIRVVR